jgi:hypothetical protein
MRLAAVGQGESTCVTPPGVRALVLCHRESVRRNARKEGGGGGRGGGGGGGGGGALGRACMQVGVGARRVVWPGKCENRNSGTLKNKRKKVCLECRENRRVPLRATSLAPP